MLGCFQVTALVYVVKLRCLIAHTQSYRPKTCRNALSIRIFCLGLSTAGFIAPCLHQILLYFSNLCLMGLKISFKLIKNACETPRTPCLIIFSLNTGFYRFVRKIIFYRNSGCFNLYFSVKWFSDWEKQPRVLRHDTSLQKLPDLRNPNYKV